MHVDALILAAIAGVLVWVLGETWMRWRAAPVVSRALEGTVRAGRNAPPRPASALEPESRLVVRLSDSEVVCERPDGKIERVGWADLEKVEVVTSGHNARRQR